VHAIEGLDELDFDPDRAVQNAERFSVAAFKRRLSEHLRTVQDKGERTSPEDR